MVRGKRPVAKRRRVTKWLPFKQARDVVQKLNLKSKAEWAAWSKSKRPTNIPSTPNTSYRDSGWVSYPDWHGYEACYARAADCLPFKRARAAVQKLKLKSTEEWWAWSKSKRPANIPGKPHEK